MILPFFYFKQLLLITNLILESCGGEDVRQLGPDCERGERASQRVVRGRLQMQKNRFALRRHGKNCQSRGKLENIFVSLLGLLVF